jgi:hypothetical protein
MCSFVDMCKTACKTGGDAVAKRMLLTDLAVHLTEW